MKRAVLKLTILMFLISPSLALAVVPKGALKLPSAKLFKADGYYCGQLKGVWVAGRRVANGYFYSHAAERKNLTAQARTAAGRKKRTLQDRAKALLALSAVRNAVCAFGPAGTPTPTPTTPPASNALRFDFSSAVGLALNSASSDLPSAASAGSNLRKVNSAGQLSEAVSSGTAVIKYILAAPNNKVYVVFSARANLEDTSQHGECLLAEVERTSGAAACIDDSLVNIDWDSRNKPIQFDDSGAIYYKGLSYDAASATFHRVLRRHLNGQRSDLISDNAQVYDFLVLPDGRLIITGITQSTSGPWIRRISAAGGITSLSTNGTANFIQAFPDGNIYFGITSPEYGIVRYLADTDLLDSQYYVRDGNTPPAILDMSPYCDSDEKRTRNQQFCSVAGGNVIGFYTTPTNKIFALAGTANNGLLFQYYPTLVKPAIAITRSTLLAGAANTLFVAGLNAQEKNVLMLLDTSTNAEVQLIEPENEIEIYHLQHVAASNAMMFDGLRFSDNKYVLGKVDLETLAVTITATGANKLADFQTF